ALSAVPRRRLPGQGDAARRPRRDRQRRVPGARRGRLRLHPDRRAPERHVRGRGASVQQGREPRRRWREREDRGAHLLRQPVRAALRCGARLSQCLSRAARSLGLADRARVCQQRPGRRPALAGVHDRQGARRGLSGQGPGPAGTPERVVQVYAARAVSWRGVFAVHTWIAVKPSGAASWTRYEVIGWGVDRGWPTVRVNRTGPDNYWFGDRPQKLVDLRGAGVDRVIAKVEAAVTGYPYPASYRTWPGPNSNTFTAWVGRQVPELRLRLPPTAIGKDYLAGGARAGT